MKFSHKSYFFLTFTLIFAVFTSCNGFFNKPDNPKQNKAEAGFTYVRILAESQSAARTVMPQDYNPTAETLTNYKLTTTFKAGDSEVEDVENSRSGLSYGDLAKIQLKLRNDKEYAFTLKAEYKGSSWSGTDTWSLAAHKETLAFMLTQSMEGTGTLSLNADVSAAGISTSIKTVKIWISDERNIDRNVQSPAKTFDYSEANPCPEHIEYSEDVSPCGKRWMLMEITDNYDLTTVVGPELAYVYPTETTSWTPVIEKLNKKYKITFSKEGFDYDDHEKPVTARLVGSAKLPEPWVQNIYETTPDLPNGWNSDLGMEDLFLPPAGYSFAGWWDGENEWYAGDPIYGDSDNHDITLVPLWERGSYIYNYSTEEEILNFIQRETKDETKTEIKVSFIADTPQTVWNTTFSALEGQSKPIVLNLQNVDAGWFATNICPDPENPNESKDFARIAGTESTPNTWLKQVQIPSNTKKIPDYAFYNCTSLEQIIYSTNFTIIEIGQYAFAKDIKFNSIYNSDKGEGCPSSGGLVIGKGAFSESGITSLPKGYSYSGVNGLTKITIGEDAYRDCQSLTSIQIHFTVDEIGANAFNGCSNLTSVEFISSSQYSTLTKTIGAGAFVGTAITAIQIPYSVQYINAGAFEGLTNLTEVTFETSSNIKLAQIKDNAFKGCGITSIEFPKSLRSIFESAFQNCTNLETVTFKDGTLIYTIDKSAFEGCTALSSVSFESTPQNLKIIGESAFEGCAFSTIQLPSTITTVGKKALAVTSSLNNGVFDFLGTETDWWYHYDEIKKNLYAYSPEEMKFILNGEATSTDIPSTLVKGAAPAAALSATNLQTLVSGKTSSSTAHFELAFSGEIASASDLAPLQNLTVGAEGATIGLDLSQVTITGTGNARSLSFDNEHDKGFFQGYSNIFPSDPPFTYEEPVNNQLGLVLKSIKLPQNLESTGEYAFAYCPKLESVTIPATVKTLSGSTFCAAESLNSVTFESGSQLITIGSEAFYHTPALTAITLPETLQEIDSRAFRESGLTSIIIPDSADFKRGTPGESIFADCKSLTSVTIGSGVTVMNGTFEGCTNLENITIKGDGRWYANFQNEISGSYNQTITEVSSNTELIDLLKTDNATRRSALYKNAQLSTVISNATDLINMMSSYFDLNYTIAISVPFSNWSDLDPLKDITLGNGHTCTIDLSAATIDAEMPEDFLSDKDSITVIPPGGAAATASFTFDIAGFSFKESFTYPDTGEIGSGTYRIEQDTQKILFYDMSGVTENELKQYLKDVILKYSKMAPLTPTGDICNYIMSEEFRYAFDTGFGRVTERTNAYPSDLDLFKVVTYTINLGTNGTNPVTFNGTMDATTERGTQEYNWDIEMASGEKRMIITGFEDSVFPFGDKEFIVTYLEGTTAKDEKNKAFVTLPDSFQEGNTTVYWIDRTITTELELISAANDGGTYALGATIEVSEPISINASLSLLSEAGNTYTIRKRKTDGEWNPKDPENPENSLAAKSLFYTDEDNDNSNINLTMENIILDGGYATEGLKGSDSGLLDFGGNKITLTNVIFQNNWKEWDWPNCSGLNLNCTTATLDNCTFKDLHISGTGARAPGINILKGAVTIKDCAFGNNTVDNANGEYNYGKDIWIDSSYSGSTVTVTGETRHLDEESYIEIGTYDPGYSILGNETGKIKVSILYNDTVSGLPVSGLEQSSTKYFHGTQE
ncbi:MAG: leucine-rich repeat domain-containing protein [Treponemataceae bacterium]|nr:leucine-rich repeat domain-containing protein [Treponemataceae bacterium]